MTPLQYDNCMKLARALRQFAPDDPQPTEFVKIDGNGDFRWDFDRIGMPFYIGNGHCGTVGCAVGLGYELGLFEAEDEISEALGLPQSWLDFFFWSPLGYPDADGFNSNVTPRMVADALELKANAEAIVAIKEITKGLIGE